MIVANTGSVSLSYDGDPRAAHLLLDESTPTSGAWSMTCTGSFRSWPVAVFRTPIGWRKCWKAVASKCLRERKVPQAL